MKASIKKMLLLAVIMLSLTAVSAVSAQASVTVEGVVYAISVEDSTIQVDQGDGVITTVYCIPFNHLAKKHNIILSVGDNVTIEAYERTFSDGTTKLVAISVNGVAVR